MYNLICDNAKFLLVYLMRQCELADSPKTMAFIHADGIDLSINSFESDLGHCTCDCEIDHSLYKLPTYALSPAFRRH